MAKAKKATELDASALEGDVDAGEATRADTGETPVPRVEEDAAALPAPDSPLPTPAAEAAKAEAAKAEAAKAEADPAVRRIRELQQAKWDRDELAEERNDLVLKIAAFDADRPALERELRGLVTEEAPVVEAPSEDPRERVFQIEAALDAIGDIEAARLALGVRRGRLVDLRRIMVEQIDLEIGDVESAIGAAREAEVVKSARKIALEKERDGIVKQLEG